MVVVLEPKKQVSGRGSFCCRRWCLDRYLESLLEDFLCLNIYSVKFLPFDAVLAHLSNYISCPSFVSSDVLFSRSEIVATNFMKNSSKYNTFLPFL